MKNFFYKKLLSFVNLLGYLFGVLTNNGILFLLFQIVIISMITAINESDLVKIALILQFPLTLYVTARGKK